jgi:hypothetical protein
MVEAGLLLSWQYVLFRHDSALDQVKEIQMKSDVQCVICLEISKIFGLLINCDHVFCLGCIRGWASAKPTSPSDEPDKAIV